MLGFAAHLPKLGWDVSVVCSDRNSWHVRVEPGLLKRVPSQVRVHRIKGRPAGTFARRVFPHRLVKVWCDLLPNKLFIPAVKLALTSLVHAPREPFVVVTSGPPHIAHLAGLLLKRVRNCVWIADFRDLWTDDPVQSWPGWYQPGLARVVERAVLRRADAITTVSQTWARLLSEKARTSVVLIRNAADTYDQSLPRPERPWPLTEPVILFAGTPQRNNTTDEIWLGIRRYLDTLPAGQTPIRFVFLGFDPETRQAVERFGIGRQVVDIGPQPHDRTVALLLGADAALVPLRASGTPASRGTIPAKLYQAMALRKPIILIADRDSEAAALLQGYEHIFAAGDDPDEIAAALHRFAAAPRPSRQPEPPAELAGWSRASATRALVDLIEKLNPAFATAGSFAGARIANAPPASAPTGGIGRVPHDQSGDRRQ
jgi:hypothetical protein